MKGAKRPFDIRFRDTRKKQFFSIFASFFLFLMTNVEDVKNMDYALVVLSCKRFLKISGPDSCMMNLYAYGTR